MSVQAVKTEGKKNLAGSQPTGSPQPPDVEVKQPEAAEGKDRGEHVASQRTQHGKDAGKTKKHSRHLDDHARREEVAPVGFQAVEGKPPRRRVMQPTLQPPHVLRVI